LVHSRSKYWRLIAVLIGAILASLGAADRLAAHPRRGGLILKVLRMGGGTPRKTVRGV
jgi:hypothetical protein